MSEEVINKGQLAFSFGQEIPSLLEPFQQKEKELGDSSPDLIPLKMQMIDDMIRKLKSLSTVGFCLIHSAELSRT